MNAYKLLTVIVVSVLVAILLASALNGFTHVSDSALADNAPTVGAQYIVPSPRSAPGKNYLPIIFLNSATAGGAWLLVGNAGTIYGTDFLGTTDNVSFTIRVSNTVAFRIAPTGGTNTPNIIGGFSGNTVAGGILGATISGGGDSGFTNYVGNHFGTVGGGIANSANGYESTIGGGERNYSNYVATVGGGRQNAATSDYATIGGGYANNANGVRSTIGGGAGNIASDYAATIPGGELNVAVTYTLAAGRRAKAIHQGAFVWGDSTDADVTSTGPDQFVIRATGGIRIAGAGISTTTPVFIWRSSVADIGGFNNDTTFIDNPLTNGDPNAILIITHNYQASSPQSPNNHPIGVWYDGGSNKWGIFNEDGISMTVGLAFNVLVIKP